MVQGGLKNIWYGGMWLMDLSINWRRALLWYDGLLDKYIRCDVSIRLAI